MRERETARPRPGRPERARVPFFTGVNYWPARTGLAMWRDFDPGEIAADFAHVAALGLDTVRVVARWDDFQPAPESADDAMLERLERLLGLAHDAGLEAIPTLFSGHFRGTNFMPEWALDRGVPAGAARTVSGDRERPYGAGDLYRGALLEAQVAFVRIAGARLREHPAIRAWDLGNAPDRVREPSHAKLPTGEHSSEPADERVLAEWSRRLAKELRDASGLPATVGTELGILTADRDVRLGTLCLPLAFASMQGESVRAFFARDRLDPEVVPFLAMLTAGFSHQSVAVTSFGAPSCPAGKFSAFERFPGEGARAELTIAADDTAFAPYPCLTERESATYASAVLDRLHADGRLGALWAAWSDPAPDVARTPPFDRDPTTATGGLVRADGSEKPVARAFAEFASEGRAIVPARDTTSIASAYYYRTLPTSAHTLYEAFLRRVAERRA